MKQPPRDPQRIDLSEARADAELKRALSALAHDRPSAEALARVQKRVMHSLGQPQSAPIALTAKLLSPQALVAAAALLVAAWLLPRFGGESLPPAAIPAAPAPGLVTAPAASPLPAPSLQTSTSASVEVAASDRPSAPPQAHRPHPRDAKRPLRGAHPQPAVEAHTQPVQQAATADETATLAPRVASERAAAAPVAPPLAAQESPKPNAASAPVADEVTLLQQARHRAGRDPDAALQLLAEHKQRYPHGSLAPEREVLAIELLRGLSRDEEAARRAQAFRHDFPGSVYLPRVH